MSRLYITKDLATTKEKQLANCLNYLYYLKKFNEKSNTTRWTCKLDTCHASITTSKDDEVAKINGQKLDTSLEPVEQLKNSHGHGPQDEMYIDTLKSLNNLKIIAKERVTSSLSSIYNEEQTRLIEKYGVDIAQTLPEFQSVRSGLYKAKRKGQPALPKSIDDINLDNMASFKETEDHRRFLLKDFSFKSSKKDATERIIIFCSDWGLEMLCKASRIHSDGTFKTSPMFFYQLYIIHSWYKQTMFPCAYVLMTTKTEESYKRVLDELKSAALSLGHDFHPSAILTDFEAAAINAYKYHFPRAASTINN
jgi:hypothetical protein